MSQAHVRICAGAAGNSRPYRDPPNWLSVRLARQYR